jgi:hypothetical protein
MPVITHNALTFLTSARYSQNMYQGPCHNHHTRKRHILITYKDSF